MSGFGVLLAQRLRRDRWQVPLWAVGTGLLALLTYVGVHESYGTEQDRAALVAAAIANPVILLFRGLPSGAQEGAFMLFLILPWIAMLAAFMSTFLAVRHTRGDEEAGRAELVAATPAGRLAPLLATIAHGVAANLALGLLVALAFLGTGLGAAGACVAGAAAAAVGIVFLGVGLVAGQLMPTSRGASSLAVWVLVVTFVLSGIGNAIGTPSDDLRSMRSSWLTWLSPFGWAENTRPYDADAWAPLALGLGVAVVLGVGAVLLQHAHDFGEGFVPEASGRATASASLSSSTALVWRLTGPAVVGWGVGGVLTGALSTSLAGVIQQVGGENPAVEQILSQLSGGSDPAQGTVVIFFTMAGILAACAAVQIVTRARQEEARGTAEPILSSPVNRVRWLADYLVAAVGAVVIVMACAVAGAALGIAGSGGEASLIGDAAVTGAGQAAAAAVFLVLTGLVLAVAARATIALGWVLVLLGAILGLFGPLFGFPDWLVHSSPFSVAPHATTDGVDAAGLVWLLLAIAVGAAASLLLTRRRELAAGG